MPSPFALYYDVVGTGRICRFMFVFFSCAIKKTVKILKKRERGGGEILDLRMEFGPKNGPNSLCRKR